MPELVLSGWSYRWGLFYGTEGVVVHKSTTNMARSADAAMSNNKVQFLLLFWSSCQHRPAWQGDRRWRCCLATWLLLQRWATWFQRIRTWLNCKKRAATYLLSWCQPTYCLQFKESDGLKAIAMAVALAVCNVAFQVQPPISCGALPILLHSFLTSIPMGEQEANQQHIQWESCE